MARSNADVVRENSEAFSRRDVDAMLKLFAPSAIVRDRREVGWGEYDGRDAIRSYYQGLFDNLDDLREDLEVVHDARDVVIGECRTRARLAGQPDGDDVTFDYALRITLADGLIEAIDIYEDAAAAGAH